MLLYLRDTTWSDELLSEHVKAARARGVPIVMAHENDPERGGCAFARFFSTTPPDLIQGGLYKALASACYPGEHRAASIALLGKALGAVQLRRFSSVSASLNPVRRLSVLRAVPQTGTFLSNLPTVASVEELSTMEVTAAPTADIVDVLIDVQANEASPAEEQPAGDKTTELELMQEELTDIEAKLATAKEEAAKEEPVE